MTQIHSIDLEGTCLKEKQQGPYAEGGTRRLMEHLHMRDQRKQAKLKMLQRMRESVYRELWDVPGGQEQIMELIKNGRFTTGKRKRKKKQYFFVVVLHCLVSYFLFVGFSFVSFCFFLLFVSSQKKKVFLCFDDLDDVKNLIRNAERLFPEAIEGAWGLIVLISLFCIYLLKNLTCMPLVLTCPLLFFFFSSQM